jgi:hypothetical protein
MGNHKKNTNGKKRQRLARRMKVVVGSFLETMKNPGSIGHSVVGGDGTDRCADSFILLFSSF